MEAVLDTNVLLSTLQSQGSNAELYFNSELALFAPKKLLAEVEKNKEAIFAKSGLSKDIFDSLLSMLMSQIDVVGIDKYKQYLSEASLLLKDHAKDEDFVALALSKNCKVWTYEALLFKIGIGISTKQIADKLREEKL